MVAKKKSMANKLARMSDEERARYLQHRADIEEEARRRKEQLIATFLKNKIKKEDAFSRLNIAKLNQHWHQVLRKAKCKEMKENVQHMKEWIERTLALKNRTIELLMEEMDEAEQQYANNFQAHVTHIEKMIERHGINLDQIRKQYEEDRDWLSKTATEEMAKLRKTAKEEKRHLQTIIFGQEANFTIEFKKRRDEFIEKQNEAMSDYRTELESMRKRLETASAAIWRRISDVVGDYVRQTDKRRLHLAELRGLDAESAAEIRANQDRIQYGEETVERLKLAEAALKCGIEESVCVSRKELEKLKSRFAAERKQLRADIARDERQLLFLSDVSNKALKKLEQIAEKGDHLLFLARSCRKYESETERKARWEQPWAPFQRDAETSAPSSAGAAEKSASPEISVSLSSADAGARRKKPPKIAAESTLKDASFSLERDDAPEKTPEYSILSGFESLNRLSGFWSVFNSAAVNLLELKEEKRALLDENKELRETMRSIMESAALAKTAIPVRNARSAPIRMF